MDNDLIEKLASKGGSTLLDVLDQMKNAIADARNGNASTESRKFALDMIDNLLYNKVKTLLSPEKEPKKPDTWL